MFSGELIPDLENIVQSYIPLNEYKELIFEIPERFTLVKYKSFQNALEKELADDINTTLTNEIPIIIQNIDIWKTQKFLNTKNKIFQFIANFNTLITNALELTNLFKENNIFYRNNTVYLNGYQLERHFYNVPIISNLKIAYTSGNKNIYLQKSGNYLHNWDKIINIENLSPLYRTYTRINNIRQILDKN